MTLLPMYKKPFSAFPRIIVPGWDDRYHEAASSRSPDMLKSGIPVTAYISSPLPPPGSLLGPDECALPTESIGDERRYHNDQQADCLQYNRSRFQLPADAHCASLRKKLDDSLTCFSQGSPPSSLLTLSAIDVFSQSSLAERRHLPASKVPLRFPVYVRDTLDSPATLSVTSSHYYITLKSSPSHHEAKSPDDRPWTNKSFRIRSRKNNNDDSVSTPFSSHSDEVEKMKMGDRQTLERLHVEDPLFSLNCQSHSSSDVHPIAMSSNTFHGGDLSSGNCPPGLPAKPCTPAIFTHSNNTTTATCFDRRLCELSGDSSSTSKSLRPAPRPVNSSLHISFFDHKSAHARNISEVNASEISSLQRASGTKVPGFLCKCCPKRRKRFTTLEKLNAHETENRYPCSFCESRFKLKNEAKRHEKSLHMRRHSWSCYAISGYDRAFHISLDRPDDADTCGFCGEEFQRSGSDPDTSASSGSSVFRYTTSQDWDERIRHLQEVHRFKECNPSKKFYRADHFVQHLKHCHAGMSGIWNLVLEKACMLNEGSVPSHLNIR